MATLLPPPQQDLPQDRDSQRRASFATPLRRILHRSQLVQCSREVVELQRGGVKQQHAIGCWAAAAAGAAATRAATRPPCRLLQQQGRL